MDDPANAELEISGTPCRKLGMLKNGETAEFLIDDNEHKIFVIADTMSKNYCNDFYAVPAGTEDVRLSGKNKLNPGTGNAFVFDNNHSEAALQNRSKNKKKGWVVWVCAIVVGVIIGGLVGYLINKPKDPSPRTFRAQELTVTLTDAFTQKNDENFAAYISSKNVAVLGGREIYTEIPTLAAFTAEEYADAWTELVAQGGKTLSGPFSGAGTRYYFYDFTNEATNQTLRYYTFFFKGSEAFWTLQFAVNKEEADSLQDDVLNWAATVTVD